jgi:hypothetical protein
LTEIGLEHPSGAAAHLPADRIFHTFAGEDGSAALALIEYKDKMLIRKILPCSLPISCLQAKLVTREGATPSKFVALSRLELLS